MVSALSAIRKLVQKPSRSVMILHRHPDGDCIGSVLAWAALLKKFKHEVTIYTTNPIPEVYSFLRGIENIRITSLTKIPWKEYDIFWVLDAASPSMIGEDLSVPKSVKIVNIDHHKTNLLWGKVNFVDPKASSVGVILFEIFKKWGLKVDKKLAESLMTAVVTDTGAFGYANTDSRTLGVASELLEKGVDYQKIIFEIYQQYSPEDIVFLTKALSTLKIYPKKKAVVVTVSAETWQNCGKSKDRNVSVTNYIRGIVGTDFGVLLTEEKPRVVRVELRSRESSFDVSKIAEKLGGGGHCLAAGAKLKGVTLKEAVKKVLSMV